MTSPPANITSTPPKRTGVVWVGLALTVVTILAALMLSRLNRERAEGALSILFSVPDFALTNQHQKVITRADFSGQVWVADIIFTRCGGPCPQMTTLMAGLQTEWPADARVKFVTLTTDPEFDTPSVMKTYAQRFGANSERWHFLTGTKQQIGHLAIDGLKLTAIEKSQAERNDDRDLFVHSTIFVLVDQQARVRAVFESDQPDMRPKLVSAVNRLLREKQP